MKHEQLNLIVNDIRSSLTEAEEWPNYNSAHELLGVLQEEFKEFCAIVYQKQRDRDPLKMRKELSQIIAVCMRGIECIDTDSKWIRK